MKKPALSKEELSKMFNVPIENISQQYKDNAAHMRKMAEKARKSGKKEDGLTADEWDEKAKWFEELAVK